MIGRHLKIGLAVGLAVTSAAFVPAHVCAKPVDAAARAPTKRMNVLLIISDDLNTRMNVSGFPEVKTPNLDRLAENAVNFRHAYTQFPLCGPSRASFLTGLRPDSSGIFDLQTKLRDKVPNAVTLPQYFRQKGYFSGRVGKIFHQGVPSDIGTSGPDDPQSWDQVVNPKGHDKQIGDANEVTNLTPGETPIKLGLAFAYRADEAPDAEQTDGKVAAETIKMLAAHKDAPFFIAAGFYRPHVPEIAPKKYFDMYPLESLHFTPESDKDIPIAARQQIFDHFKIKLSLEAQREFVRSYYASTSFMDAQVGVVLDGLKRLGLDKNTIVVFTSDHGYALGEHGQFQKTMLLEPVTRVPLIISVPGAKGRQISTRNVELLDLYPTLAALAGLPRPANVEGRNIAPLLANPSARWDFPAHSQVKGGRSIKLGNYRYTEWEQGDAGIQLYNERTDPGEHQNLARDPAYKMLLKRMKALLPTKPVGKRAFTGFGDG